MKPPTSPSRHHVSRHAGDMCKKVKINQTVELSIIFCTFAETLSKYNIGTPQNVSKIKKVTKQGRHREEKRWV